MMQDLNLEEVQFGNDSVTHVHEKGLVEVSEVQDTSPTMQDRLTHIILVN